VTVPTYPPLTPCPTEDLSPETAGGDIPMACLHGFIESGALWRLLPDAAWHGHDAISLPLPGHAPWHLDPGAEGGLFEGTRLIDTYALTLRRRFPGRKVRLVGHSTGALVVLSLALRHPGLVRDALLIAPLFSGMIKSRTLPGRLLQIPVMGQAAFGWMVARWLANDTAYLAGFATVAGHDRRPPKPREALRRMRDDLMASDPVTLYRTGEWVGAQDLSARLGALSIPAETILCLDDPVIDPAHQMELVAAAPMMQAVLLPSGHLPFLDCPGDLLRLWDGWRARLDLAPDVTVQAS